MELPRNRFKHAIAAGQQQIGIWCTIPSSLSIEALACCGPDWLLIDTEHSPIEPVSLLPLLQAVAAYDVSAAVRPSSNDPVTIKRILDTGAQTILVPYVQDADEARAAVASTRYPPDGIRGVAGTTRATRFGRIGNYATRASEEICVLVQVETSQALSQIEAIAEVAGVDGIFVGPADLAASMGHPGNPGHPDVVAAVEDAIVRIRALNKPAGILSGDQAFLKRCLEIGSVFTAVGLDISILSKGTEALLQAFSRAE